MELETGLRNVKIAITGDWWTWSEDIHHIAKVKIQVTNIKETVRRDFETREMISNLQPMGAPTVFFIYVPVGILSEDIGLQYIVDNLMLGVGDSDLCNLMAPKIHSYASRTAGLRRSSFFVSVDTDVLWIYRVEEATERPMDRAEWIWTWLTSSSYQQHHQDQDYQHRQDQDQEDSELAMDKLRRERRVEGKAIDDGREVGCCAICLDDMSGSEDLIDMPCRHIFHDACVFPWLRNHNSCPICRRPPLTPPTNIPSHP